MTARLVAGCCTVCFAPAKDERPRRLDGEMMPHCGRAACIERLQEIDEMHKARLTKKETEK